MLNKMLIAASFVVSAVAAANDTPKPVESPKGSAKSGCMCTHAAHADQPVKAEQPAKLDPKASKLTVDGMTCAGCAKTVTKALSAVEGVESVVIDLKGKTATVTPKAAKSPSPKELWEAVEKADYKPTKLEGPDGTFEKKPTK
ncbi:hypothetical protein BH11PLA2_BH11PLA2_20960 [soil metagenome]